MRGRQAGVPSGLIWDRGARSARSLVVLGLGRRSQPAHAKRPAASARLRAFALLCGSAVAPSPTTLPGMAHRRSALRAFACGCVRVFRKSPCRPCVIRLSINEDGVEARWMARSCLCSVSLTPLLRSGSQNPCQRPSTMDAWLVKGREPVVVAARGSPVDVPIGPWRKDS